MADVSDNAQTVLQNNSAAQQQAAQQAKAAEAKNNGNTAVTYVQTDVNGKQTKKVQK